MVWLNSIKVNDLYSKIWVTGHNRLLPENERFRKVQWILVEKLGFEMLDNHGFRHNKNIIRFFCEEDSYSDVLALMTGTHAARVNGTYKGEHSGLADDIFQLLRNDEIPLEVFEDFL